MDFGKFNNLNENIKRQGTYIDVDPRAHARESSRNDTAKITNRRSDSLRYYVHRKKDSLYT